MKQLSIIFLAIVAIANLSISAFAASSKWQDLGGGKARIVAVKDPFTSKIEGVVEIQLDKGWKTYWRSPGDAGIPPEFDFSASNFVELTDVQFPTPKVIIIPDTYFMGYQGNVRFVFKAESFAENASLNINMLAGVCEEICIPATASFHLSAKELNVSDPLATSIIDLAKLELPLETSDAVSVENVKLTNNQLVVSAKLPSDEITATFLLEGPNGWFSGPIKNNGNIFTVDMGDEFTAEDNWQTNFRYTIVHGKTSVSNALSKLKF